MAGVIHQHFQNQIHLHLRYHFDPLNENDDSVLFACFLFRRQDIIQIVDILRDTLKFGYMRKGALSPKLQVLLTLWFYVTSSLQIVAGDTVNVAKSTVSLLQEAAKEEFCVFKYGLNSLIQEFPVPENVFPPLRIIPKTLRSSGVIPIPFPC